MSCLYSSTGNRPTMRQACLPLCLPEGFYIGFFSIISEVLWAAAQIITSISLGGEWLIPSLSDPCSSFSSSLYLPYHGGALSVPAKPSYIVGLALTVKDPFLDPAIDFRGFLTGLCVFFHKLIVRCIGFKHASNGAVHALRVCPERNRADRIDQIAGRVTSEGCCLMKSVETIFSTVTMAPALLAFAAHIL